MGQGLSFKNAAQILFEFVFIPDVIKGDADQTIFLLGAEIDDFIGSSGKWILDVNILYS